MPAIASSKEELVAVLKLAGLKKPKPARVDRAWWALTSGESRGSSSSSNGDPGGGSFGMYYVRGGALAAKVTAAGLLRNPDLGVVLTAALAMAVMIVRKLFGRAGSSGEGGEAATSLNGGDRGPTADAEEVASGGHFRKGGAMLGLPRRGHSSLSPRRLAGS